MTTEAQIMHATHKMNNPEKSKEDVSKTKAQLQAKVTSLQQELVSIKKAAEHAQGQWEWYTSSSSYLVNFAGEQRKSPRHNIALSKESLDEY